MLYGDHAREHAAAEVLRRQRAGDHLGASQWLEVIEELAQIKHLEIHEAEPGPVCDVLESAERFSPH